MHIIETVVTMKWRRWWRRWFLYFNTISQTSGFICGILNSGRNGMIIKDAGDGLLVRLLDIDSENSAAATEACAYVHTRDPSDTQLSYKYHRCYGREGWLRGAGESLIMQRNMYQAIKMRLMLPIDSPGHDKGRGSWWLWSSFINRPNDGTSSYHIASAVL